MKLFRQVLIRSVGIIALIITELFAVIPLINEADTIVNILGFILIFVVLYPIVWLGNSIFKLFIKESE